MFKTFWISKGTSGFCEELQYDFETDSMVKSRPDGFYDIVSTKDTVEGGLKVIEAEPALARIAELEQALKDIRDYAEDSDQRREIARRVLSSIVMQLDGVKARNLREG